MGFIYMIQMFLLQIVLSLTQCRHTKSAFNMMLIVEYVPLKQKHSIKSNRIIFILKSM